MSEKVSITKSKLDSLANAIAAVGETSVPKTIAQMESAVLELTIPPNLQSKTITPSLTQQIVSPDSGYDAFSQVTVDAMPSGTATTPATTITANPTISVSSDGLITAAVSAEKSITPTVSAGYISSGIAGTATVSGSATEQLTTQAAQIIHPSTTDQTIVSGKYLTGAQTIKGVTLTNLTAGNIKKDVVVKIGDSTDDDCVTSITGTYGDIYDPIYKSLAYRSVIASSAPGVGEWCNSLSSIYSFQFAGQSLSGSFIFSNVSVVGQYAFAWNYVGGFTGGVPAYNLTFPILSRFYDNAIFAMNRGLTSIYCPSMTTIGSYTFYNCYDLTTISFPECTSISSYAFYNCSNLTTISFPECTTIGKYAFQQCKNLTTISFPECTTIGGTAFYSCSKLTSIYFPKCTSIGSNAFYSCPSLVTISFPECTSIGDNAFQSCSNLTTISFPSCTSIGNWAFHNCSKLTTASFPSCTSIGYSAFYNCSSLTTASFPKCTFIGSNAFWHCSSLTTISFPECITIGGQAFSDCRNLTTASFSKCTSIGSYTFYYCTSLSQIYFMGNLIPSIGTNIFAYTPMSLSSYLGYFGSIYVPSSLLASYKTAANWSLYSARIVGI